MVNLDPFFGLVPTSGVMVRRVQDRGEDLGDPLEGEPAPEVGAVLGGHDAHGRQDGHGRGDGGLADDLVLLERGSVEGQPLPRSRRLLLPLRHGLQDGRHAPGSRFD